MSAGKDQTSSGSVRLSQMTRQFREQEEGDAAARRALNSLAVTSALVNALIEHPGPDSEHAAMVRAAQMMLKAADGATQTLIQDLQLQNVSWAQYRVMRMVSSAVAVRWGATARAGEPRADVSDLLP